MRPAGNGAFTLLEVLLVLVLTALLAAMAGMSLASAVRAAGVEDSVGQMIFADAAARQAARTGGREVRITIDPRAGRVTRGAEGREATVVRLGAGVRMDQVLTAATGRGTDGAAVPIVYSERGESPSFAVRVAGTNGERQWVVFAGITGAVLRTRDDREVQSIFAALALAPAGGDAR